MLGKKIIAMAISTALMGAGNFSVASAAVKAGQSCSKAGATSTSKGIKYTCIKSGKKLVWNKGVKIIPVAKPTPTPTPTATPTTKPVVKKTITCVKGKKSVKKTAVSPKCPKGYKVKKK
jgi:hypothetical protein